MVWFRLTRGLIVCMGSLLPLCILWQLMLPHASRSGNLTKVMGIPNPAKAPVSMLGPIEVLVYADPWFAGVAWVWVIACGITLAILIATALCLPLSRQSAGSSMIFWGLGSLLVGLVIASPWMYGLNLLKGQ